MKLSRDDVMWLRRVLMEDIKERKQYIRQCGTGTSDDILTERIEAYNHSKELLERIDKTLGEMIASSQLSTTATVVGDDDMYKVD